MIIGLCGLAGSGKDTAADFLVRNYDFVKVAFADPLKRICFDVFEFSEEQLWGSSEKRNAPDFRYARRVRVLVDQDEYEYRNEFLTPRYALQQLGSEWGRHCYSNIWVDYALRVAKRLGEGGHIYHQRRGLSPVSFVGLEAKDAYERLRRNVVISDVRFKNEIDKIHDAGGLVYRLMRGEGLSGEAGQHVSERELQSIPLETFDGVIDNRNWSLEDLEAEISSIASKLVKKGT